MAVFLRHVTHVFLEPDKLFTGDTPPWALWFILFKTSCESNLKTFNACWSWENGNGQKINLSEPALYIWSKCLDGWKGSVYIIRFSLCYLHVFTISSWMLKQFIDLKNVLTSSGLLFFFFGVGTCLAISVSLGSHCNIILQPTVASLFLPKWRRTSLATWWKSADKQCHFDFQIGDLWENTTNKGEILLRGSMTNHISPKKKKINNRQVY